MRARSAMCRKLLNGGVLFLRWRVGCIQLKAHIRGSFLLCVNLIMCTVTYGFWLGNYREKSSNNRLETPNLKGLLDSWGDIVWAIV